MLSDIKILIIYNPKAGKGKIKSIMPEVKRMYTKAGLNPLFHATKRRDDAYETAGKFVKKYYGNTVVSDRKNSLYVIAAGGDGTRAFPSHTAPRSRAAPAGGRQWTYRP